MNLKQLHMRLNEHLKEQSKNWTSFIYAQEKGFYQGFDEIKITGCRSTEKRFQRYNITKYLTHDKNVLDIGSNCGFFSLYISRFVKSVTGVEINPFLIAIANDVKNYLEIKNTKFVCSSFEDFDTLNKFDIVCSLANDSTIDNNTKFNFKHYIEKIFNLLSKNGILIFESQALDVVVPQQFTPKMDIMQKYFKILEKKMVPSEYPLNVKERHFLVLEKS